MSKVFNIGESKIEFSGDIETYNEIWKKLLLKSQEEIRIYKKFYDDEIDIDGIVKNGYIKGIQSIDNVFLSFADLFIAKGWFDFSADYLKDNQKYQNVIQYFKEAFNDIVKKVDSLDDYEKTKALEREMAKSHRYKIRGGGFGVVGAAKGIIQAEAVNLTTGLVYSGFNLIGNFFTSMAVTETKSDLYEKSKDYLCMCLYKSMVAVMDVLVDELKLGVLFFPEKAEKIIENIENGTINGDTVKLALNESIKQNPYNDKIYTQYCLYYNIFENDIVDMAKYFGIDLDSYVKKLHEYNNYYFDNIWLAYAAKQCQEELNKDFNKIYRYDFSEKMYDDNFWITCDNPELLKYIINSYDNLKKRFKIENDENIIELKKLVNISNFDELQNYFDENINYFKEKLDLLLNTGCCIKSYESEEFRKAIFDLLDKYEIGKKDRNIYLGNYITEEHINEAGQIFNEELKKCDIYIYIKAKNYYGIEENIFLFTSIGAFFGNDENKEFVRFDDIREVKVWNNVFSDYDSVWVTCKSNHENLISLDDEYIYYISEEGYHVHVKAEYIVKIINDILKLYENDKYIKNENKEKQLQLEKNDGNIQDNNVQEFNLLSFIENKYKFLEEKEKIFIGKNIPEDLLNKAIADYAYFAHNKKSYLLIHSREISNINSLLFCSNGLYIGKYKLGKIEKEFIKYIDITELNRSKLKYDAGFLSDTIRHNDREIYREISVEKVMSSLVNFINELIPVAYFEYSKEKSKNEGIYCAITGDLLRDGKGVKQDLLQAAYAYFKGIILFNDDWCLYGFGKLYFDGILFNKDLRKAKYWFLQAAKVAKQKGQTDEAGVLKNIKNRYQELKDVEPVSEKEACNNEELNKLGFLNIIARIKLQKEKEEKYYLKPENLALAKKNSDKYKDYQTTFKWHFYPNISDKLVKYYINEVILGHVTKYEDILMMLTCENDPCVIITKWGINSIWNTDCLLCDVKSITLKNNTIYVNEQFLLKCGYEDLVSQWFEIITSLFDGEYKYNNIVEKKKMVGISINLSEVLINTEDLIKNINSHKNILNSGFYWIEEIPEKKIINVLKTYAKDLLRDDIVILYDDTIFGSAKDGFVLHKYGLRNSKGLDIYLKNISIIKSVDKELHIILTDGTEKIFWEFLNNKICASFVLLLGGILKGERIYKYRGIYPECDSIEFVINN